MKLKLKIYTFIKSSFLLTAIFCALCFSSCKFVSESWNAPVKDYFKDYTETAGVMQWELVSGSAVYDSDGTVILSSGEDAVFNLFIRNPQGYNFTLSNNMTYSFDEEELENAQNLFGVTLEDSFTELSQGEEKSVLVLRYSKDFLVATETGFDISPVVNLRHPVSGVNFGDYTELKVKCNSAPPPLYGAVVYKDTSTQKYVILFNMPQKSLLAGIHRDIKTISVNGTESAISLEDDGSFSFENTKFAGGDVSASYTAGSSDFVENGQPAVFYTDDIFTDETIVYSIILTDNAGLKTGVKTDITSIRLEKVTLQNSERQTLEDGERIAQDEGLSYATIYFVPAATAKDNADTSDSIIVYEVYQGTDDTGKIIYSGKNSGGEMKLMLPAGENLIRVYSHKDLYADSIPVDYGVKVLKSTLYVAQDGSDTANNGSKSSPFATVTHAISDDGFDDLTEECTLRVSGEISDSPKLTTANANLTIEGITGSDSISNFTMNANDGTAVLSKMNVTGDVTVKNGTLELSDSTVAGDLALGSGSLVLKGSTTVVGGLSLAEDCTIAVEDLTAEKVATIKGINTWNLGTTVLTGEGITYETCLKFSVDGTKDGKTLCLKPSSDGKSAVLALEGVSIETEMSGVEEYELELTYEAEDNKITLTAKKDGSEVTPDSVTYKLYQNKVYLWDFEDGALPAILPAGDYTVIATATIGSYSYDVEKDITISAETDSD